MDQQVKRVKRELIKHGAILDMYEDTMELPDGKQETWDFISHRKGAAAVVPAVSYTHLPRNSLRCYLFFGFVVDIFPEVYYY